MPKRTPTTPDSVNDSQPYRGQVVPAGDVEQRRHHFTQLDQVDQLVEASEADPDMGFMTRLLALSRPRSVTKIE